jgi:hypothetical protein
MKNDETLNALRKLQRQVPEPQEAHGLLMLLGNGMAEAVVGLRARQAVLELARASARGSASADARRAEAEASAAALTAVRAEVRRLRVQEPRSGDGVTSVYGHVLDEGEPVVGAQVALVDGEEALVCVDTDKAGSFALSADSEGPLSLRVSVGDEVVHRDDEATLRPASLAPYRLVELGDATADAPSQHPCEDGADQPKPSAPMPKPGGSLTQVLKELQAADVTVAHVRLTASDDATPKVSDIRDLDGGIGLDVQGRTTDGGRLAVVAALLAHQPEAEAAGIGSATAATALLRAGRVTTWDEARRASRLKIDDLAQRFGLSRDQAAALRLALGATLSKIDLVEEG